MGRIAERLAVMLFRGMSADKVVAEVEILEREATEPLESRRKYDRERKAAKRREAKMSAEHKSDPLYLSSSQLGDSRSKKEGPLPDLFGGLPAVVDDWPEDYADQFWGRWPRHPRKHSQKQVFAKLARVRQAGGIKINGKLVPVTWTQIWGGLNAYLASDPEPKFIPCPVVWVNQARWAANYDVVTSVPKRKSFMDVARGVG